MQYIWLHQNHSDDCLLFLAGWGMDSTPFADIPGQGLDVLMLYDYRELLPVPTELLKGYGKVYLLAWSMGVWVAGHLFAGQQDFFSRCIAIGGTLEPIHQEKGIPPESYNSIETAPEVRGLDDFYRSMFTDDNQTDRFLNSKPQRSINEVYMELHLFKERCLRLGPAADIFTTKLVTSRDRVFPLRNQLRAWGRKKCIVHKLPHFPFYACTGWRALIS
ncbi:MAG: hypothetical protein CSA32_02985 [Desulfobulbus propionicus]|nr:MAG: hypothetical protein CSA32_02985 [Desulfobulbus propionicus]